MTFARKFTAIMREGRWLRAPLYHDSWLGDQRYFRFAILRFITDPNLQGHPKMGDGG